MRNDPGQPPVISPLGLRPETLDAPDGLDVGARLRRVREARGLSQRELARRSGVTNGTISLIEQNKNSPSVASLKKVLDGIPLSLTEFFALDEAPETQVFFRAEELIRVTDGLLEFKRVGTGEGDRLQMMVERYQPGADTGRALYHHEGEEAGVVIAGHVEITVGAERRTLGPNEAYHFDSRIPHRFRNPGKEIAVLISACTPPSF